MTRDLSQIPPPVSERCGAYDHDWRTIQRYKDGLVTKRCVKCRKVWTYQQQAKQRLA